MLVVGEDMVMAVGSCRFFLEKFIFIAVYLSFITLSSKCKKAHPLQLINLTKLFSYCFRCKRPSIARLQHRQEIQIYKEGEGGGPLLQQLHHSYSHSFSHHSVISPSLSFHTFIHSLTEWY